MGTRSPTVPSLLVELDFSEGSRPDPEVFAIASGDPSVSAPLRFRISGTGTGPFNVFFRMGAQVVDPITVRCELRHPERGVSFREGTIDSQNPFVATGSNGKLAYPVVQSTNLLGHGRAELILECPNSDAYDDAPVETVLFRKRSP